MKFKNIALVLLLCPISCLAGPHREIDVGATSGNDGRTFAISFCARASRGALGVPGHSFIAFSETNQEGERIYTAVGHTTHAGPARAILSYGGFLGATDGDIEAERYSDATENCLVVNTNQALYERAWRTVTGFEKATPAEFAEGRRVSLDYTLGSEDCMGLMIGVARQFSPSVRIPARKTTELPLDYIQRMILEN